MRRLGTRLLAFGALAVLAAPAAAQEAYVLRSSPAWLGISYDARWVLEGGSCTSEVLVETVIQGSPAERAGLRVGDAIVAVNGDPVPPGRLQALASRLATGDSVRLRFLRGGTEREVTAVADRRPARPLTVYVDGGVLRSRGAPVVEVVGDRLIARNAADWDPGSTRNYWMRDSDGRAEYRVIGRWSSSELDRRVNDLLECAEDTQRGTVVRTNPAAGQRANIQLIQERADSLKVVWSQERTNVLRSDSVWIDVTRPDSMPGVLFRRPDSRRGESRWEVAPFQQGYTIVEVDSGGLRLFGGPDSGFVRLESPALSYTFRVEDHMAVGLRGVAGAELSALEPELAEYFRNVDQGLLVLRIAPGTPADRAGLRPGDVVTSADGRRVESVAELRQIIALPTANAVDLRVVRRGRTHDLVLRRE